MRSRVRLIPALGLALSLACSGAAAAPEANGVAVAFGNTIKATYPDGRVQRYWLQPDGTWKAVGRRGKPSSGKWSLKGEVLCLKQTKPFPAPTRYCTPFPRDGASWPAKDAGGGKITLSLVKGAS